MSNCTKCSKFHSAFVRPFCDQPDCPVRAIGETAEPDEDFEDPRLATPEPQA